VSVKNRGGELPLCRSQAARTTAVVSEQVPRALTTIGLAILVVLAVASPAGADRVRVEGLKAISGETPFPDRCGVPDDFVTGSEGDPLLAVNPRDPSNIIVAHTQDKRTIGSALLSMARVTTDGGQSWRQVVPPGVSRCAGGTAPHAASPWVAFDAEGIAYYSQNADYPRRMRPLPFLADHAIPVSTSRDRGLSWSQPTFVGPIPKEGEPRGQDRSSVTTDPTRPGVAYAVWQIVGLPANFAGVAFSRTTDHGRTWSRERVIYDQPASAAFGATVSVLPDGTVVCTFLEFPLETQTPGAAKPENLRFPIKAIRSTDGGETWSNAVEIADAADDNPRDAETTEEVRDVPWPRAAVTPDGTLHLVWYSVEGERSPLLYSRSRDGGRSFSRPRKIVDGPEQHFGPALAAGKDGTLGLTYYDDRSDRPGDQQFTLDAWFTHSHDGGASWAKETHLAGPFDASTAAPTRNRGGFAGRFLGDQQGLAAIPGGFAAAFTVAKPVARRGPTDIFFAKLRTALRRRCLSRRSPIGPRNIGRIRLRYTRRRLLRLPVKPLRRTRRSYRYCVKGGSGRLSAVFSSRSARGRVRLVTTSARGHGNRRVRVRSPAASFRRAYPNRRRIGRGLYRAEPRSPRIFGLRRGRVRFIAVADRRLLRSRRLLRRYLRLAGVGR
jgi:BNR repeat protein